jgi:serine/threonine-protein kinase RsbT
VRVVTANDTANVDDNELLPLIVTVIGEADVSHARILAAGMAERMGFGRANAHGLATAVTELAHNLVFHATNGGRISLTPLFDAERQGIEMVIEDDGPGIADLSLAMTDGFTTNGGLGSGLPGSRRLLDELSITSTFGKGTRVVGRLWR